MVVYCRPTEEGRFISPHMPVGNVQLRDGVLYTEHMRGLG
jgi:hypothetical protein